MIVVSFVLLFELTFAAERDHIVLDRQIEILSIHARKFSFQDNLLFVFIDVHVGTPCAACNTFFVKRARDTAGKKPVHFFLKCSQVAKRVITNNTHNSHCLQNPRDLPGRLDRAPERVAIINTESGIVKFGKDTKSRRNNSCETGVMIEIRKRQQKLVKSEKALDRSQ